MVGLEWTSIIAPNSSTTFHVTGANSGDALWGRFLQCRELNRW